MATLKYPQNVSLSVSVTGYFVLMFQPCDGFLTRPGCTPPLGSGIPATLKRIGGTANGWTGGTASN